MTELPLLLKHQPDPDEFLRVLSSETFKAALLCQMEFKSGTLYISNWNVGFDVNGIEWRGLGGLVGMSNIASGPDSPNPLMEYYLGIPTEFITDQTKKDMARIPELLGDPDEYSQRIVQLSALLFEEGKPVGVPFALHTGRMARPHVSVKAGEPIIFRINSESILLRHRTPPAGKLTHADQTFRHPGDMGLKYVSNANSEPLDWFNS